MTEMRGEFEEKIVVCLVDVKPGHANKARDLAALVARRIGGRVVEVHARAWTRPLGRLLQRCWPLGRNFGRFLLEGELPRGSVLLVGSGGNSLWVLAALGHSFACPSVFVGRRRQLPAEALTLSVGADPGRVSERELFLPLLGRPLEKKGENWRRLAAERGLADDDYTAVLVGGDGGGYQWSDDEAGRLAAALRQDFAERGRKVLISTSRRTPLSFEKMLREVLPVEMLADACWWRSGDERRVVKAYLEGAGLALVGEDSMSMVQEALTGGLPVLAFRGRNARVEESSLRFLNWAEGEGALGRWDLGEEGGLAERVRDLRAIPRERVDEWQESFFRQLAL
ncbi:MAG: ELM1/GtrOC1 family putative glycosyltransferase [Verrucomicrobiales bacterium]